MVNTGKGKRTVLITGSIGFIGFHISMHLLKAGHIVVGVDCCSDYYDVDLKKARLSLLNEFVGYRNIDAEVQDVGVMKALLSEWTPEVVIHLAAQAGVRYSIENPRSYVDSNILGTFELLEAAKDAHLDHLLIASTSSVYGGNINLPYSERDLSDHQLSIYAATKKAGENLAHSYSHLFGIPTSILRFFTVYGPWGRPDMALFKFTKAIVNNEAIEVYNNGEMSRDFTYIEDLVRKVSMLIDMPPPPILERSPDRLPLPGASPVAQYRVVNVANSQPYKLLAYIEAIENALGKKAIIKFLPMQPGDMVNTWAGSDVSDGLFGEISSTDISVGVSKFVDWYREFYGV